MVKPTLTIPLLCLTLAALGMGSPSPQKGGALLIARPPAPLYPLYVTNSVGKILEWTGTTNPITGLPNYMQIVPPPNTNSYSTGWISFTWNPITVKPPPGYRVVMRVLRNTDLTTTNWIPYEDLADPCTNMIEPNRGGNWFFEFVPTFVSCERKLCIIKPPSNSLTQ